MNFALPQNDALKEQQEIAAYLAAANASPEIIICKSDTYSTNDDARQLYQQGYQSGMVVSLQQRQGRGQRQRPWVSTVGNIFFSALLPLERPLDGRFSLECGLGLIHCPSLQGLAQLQLKWANDLYSPLGKWGGILIEPINAKQVVVGVGINLVPIDQNVQTQAVTSLSALGLSQLNRSQLLSEIYLAVQQASQWFNFDCQNLAQRFNQVAAFMQQEMCLSRENTADVYGTYLGIQDDGALLMQTEQQLIQCYAGRLIPKLGEQYA